LYRFFRSTQDPNLPSREDNLKIYINPKLLAEVASGERGKIRTISLPFSFRAYCAQIAISKLDKLRKQNKNRCQKKKRKKKFCLGEKGFHEKQHENNNNEKNVANIK
jgi:hypothetical protein